MNLRLFKNRKILISAIFWTIGRTTENTRVLKGLESCETLGFISI